MPGHISTAEKEEHARREFDRTRRAAKGVSRKMHLFELVDEDYIQREVERKLFKAKLPSAGERERKFLRRLRAMTEPEYWEKEVTDSWRARDARREVEWLTKQAAGAVKAWSALLPQCGCGGMGCGNCWNKAGRYYGCHPLTAKNAKDDWVFAQTLRGAAGAAKDWEVKWFAQLLLDGLPEPVSDFAVEPLCGVRRWDNSVLRLIRLKNVVGKQTEVLEIEADDFAAPERWRAWCLKVGTMSWKGNQTHLQALHEDTNRQIDWKIMKGIYVCGWVPIPRKDEQGRETVWSATPGVLHGAWFLGDCMYYEGVAQRADDEGIYWIGEQGFYCPQQGRETSFLHGKPKLHPDRKFSEGELMIEEWVNKPVSEGKAEIAKAESKKAEKSEQLAATAGFTETELLRAFFREVCHRFNETLGGYEGCLLVGALLSYTAAPELFALVKSFGGTFVHGEMSSGKTVVVEWAMALRGFDVTAGTGKKATAVGILQQSENYSNEPVWVDEFRQRETSTEILGVLRDAHSRQSSPKWTPDGLLREIRTAFIVSGETTAGDAATRSRYTHIQVSARRRVRNHFAWFTHHKPHLMFLGRFVLERRAEFVIEVKRLIKVWFESAQAKTITNERDKMVHAVHWASWMAMVSLLESHEPAEVGEFTQFVWAHARAASQDVASETNINIFWGDLITGFKAKAIPVECFRVKTRRTFYPVEGRDENGVPNAGPLWESDELYIEPRSTLGHLKAFLVKQHGEVTLSLKDLRDQISKNEYYIRNGDGEPADPKHPKDPRIFMRFGAKGSMYRSEAWGIWVDKHPLGLQPVQNGEWEASLDPRTKELHEIGPIFLEGDPRKGPLYAIVQAVKEHQDEQRRQERQPEDEG